MNKFDNDFNVYDFLGSNVDHNSSRSDIKRAYILKYSSLFKEVKTAYSNKEEDKIIKQLKFLNSCYNTLRDDRKRKEYDEFLFEKKETEKNKFLKKVNVEFLYRDLILLKNHVDKFLKK
ncbi:MAG: hypothetical protein HRS50_00415 [Mycoplasmataceae bacterium]|nr:hypothetical protein [Mycoplasmataceae bacterium]